MKKIVLWSLCTIFCLATQAQQNYEKAYKKARAFTNTNQDSALVWAEKCLILAKTKPQKYKAYYLRGFNAKKLCMYGTARYDYARAREFAPDSVSYFRINNNLANTYLAIGKYELAVKLNQKSIEFSQKVREWINLSYAYEVKSNILRRGRDRKAITTLQKVIKLRKQHAPKQLGYVYERMAKTLATFTKYDSAIAYQRLAVKHHPITSSENVASLHTQLAKYLIMGNQANKAYRHLEKARNLKKPPMMQLFWCHTFGLYLAQIGQLTKAKQTFVHCNDLLQNLLDNASDWVTQRTISQYAQEMYSDVLTLKHLKVTERQLYETRLRAVKASYERANTEIRLKDTLYQQNIAYKTNHQAITIQTKPVTDNRKFWYWLIGIIAVLGLGMGWYWQSQTWHLSSKANQSAINDEMLRVDLKQLQKAQALLAEDKLIKLIEEKTKMNLPTDTKTMVRLYYQGLSMKKIAHQMNTTFDKVRYRFRDISSKAGFKSLKEFIETYKVDQNRNIIK